MTAEYKARAIFRIHPVGRVAGVGAPSPACATTRSGYDALVAKGFYKQEKYAGREVAIESLTRTPPTPLSRGLRLGYFRQIKKIIGDELEQMLAGKKTAQEALDNAVKRGNEQLRRFEKQYKGQSLP